MIPDARSSKSSVGFLNPHLVSMQSIQEDASFVEAYMMMSLLALRNKEFRLLPYNQG